MPNTVTLSEFRKAVEGNDAKALAAFYADDAELRVIDQDHPPSRPLVLKGKPAIRAMLESVLGPAGAENRSNFHIISNPQIDIAQDGNSARATSRYLFVMRGPDGRPVPSLAGIYRDELVRGTTGWVIQRRVADDIMPTPEEWRKIIAAQPGTAK